MKDIFRIVKNISSIRKNWKQIQLKLHSKKISFSANDGKIVVIARGDISIESIKIDPAFIEQSKPEELEKYILHAVDGALNAAKKMVADEVKGLSSEAGLPGDIDISSLMKGL